LPDAVIAATGLYTPPNSLSNAELVETFNAYVARFNKANAKAIAAGEVAELAPSSPEFIEKASASSWRTRASSSGGVGWAIFSQAASAVSPDSAPALSAT
jgi:beta-ketodecanoyl-[acyl-carrier-protein] synthase